MNAKKLELLLGFVGLASAFAADRISKSWALTNLEFNESVTFIKGLINLRLVHNTGAAFSLGHDNGTLMTAVACTACILLSIWIFNRYRRSGQASSAAFMLERFGAGVLLGGAFGNLFDRFTLGRVTDFLEFAFITFPIFNVADALIDLGLFFMMLAILQELKSHAK